MVIHIQSLLINIKKTYFFCISYDFFISVLSTNLPIKSRKQYLTNGLLKGSTKSPPFRSNFPSHFSIIKARPVLPTEAG